MLDIHLIRKNPNLVRDALKARNSSVALDAILALDEKHRDCLTSLEELNQRKNQANLEVVKLKKAKEDASGVLKEMKDVSDEISLLKKQSQSLSSELKRALLYIPNILTDKTPLGLDPSANKVVREVGEKPSFNFEVQDHVALSESLGMVDFSRSTKLSGSSFILFQGQGARLERALIQMMLDTHTQDHGYKEISPPFLVKRKCMEGTGQLPKFEEDMYRIYRGSGDLENGIPEEQDMFLIPTAEVPVTNMHREEIIHEGDLPLAYCAYTPCFRLEAGAYGKETKGMTRVHQFDKVELVKFCKPEDSDKELEVLLGNAETILQKLEIPYRVLALCSSDLGFSAAQCYDIEVWAPGTDNWLEASSCSNFLDFQARRAGIKYKNQAEKKVQHVHTLNGSGVALARTFIALLENHQQPDGSIRIPQALQPYMGGQACIKP